MKDRDQLLAKARQALQWDALLEALAGRTVSSLGTERCRSLPLAGTIEEARSLLRETAEMAAKAAANRLKSAQKTEKRKTSGVAVLPGKLSDAATDDPVIREIFLVEGDSYGATYECPAGHVIRLAREAPRCCWWRS